MTKKNTRKTKIFKKRDALSIPELKHAWDEIHKSTHDILKEGKPVAEQIKEFQKMWKKIFHRPVSTESAEAYLRIKRLTTSRHMGRKTRKMKGGAALAGAPLDSVTQPGVYGTHGSFPSYQSNGLGFYDMINKQAMFQECGYTDITPVTGGTIKSDQVGGGVSNILSIAPHSSLIGNKPAVPGPMEHASLALKGFPTDSSSSPTILRA
jgi:hypothetical protein